MIYQIKEKAIYSESDAIYFNEEETKMINDVIKKRGKAGVTRIKMNKYTYTPTEKQKSEKKTILNKPKKNEEKDEK